MASALRSKTTVLHFARNAAETKRIEHAARLAEKPQGNRYNRLVQQTKQHERKGTRDHKDHHFQGAVHRAENRKGKRRQPKGAPCKANSTPLTTRTKDVLELVFSLPLKSTTASDLHPRCEASTLIVVMPSFDLKSLTSVILNQPQAMHRRFQRHPHDHQAISKVRFHPLRAFRLHILVQCLPISGIINRTLNSQNGRLLIRANTRRRRPCREFLFRF